MVRSTEAQDVLSQRLNQVHGKKTLSLATRIALRIQDCYSKT